MKSRKYLILFSMMLILTFISCAKKPEQNQAPQLNVSQLTDGLKVTLTGNTTDADGVIKEVIVNWGDNQNERLTGIEATNINKSHTYQNPINVEIVITAYDTEGAHTSKNINLNLTYKEIDLSSMKDSMFKTSVNEYLILTVNLHTYQESQQNEKFNILIDFIGKMDVDFIAFQECAQNKSSANEFGNVRTGNMALVIANGLKDKYQANYNIVWDWAHYGWNIWEEGIAVMSKYQRLDNDSKYISTNTSVNDIVSRKVIYGSYQTPNGRVNIASTHTHWRVTISDNEQDKQINNVKLFVNQKDLLNPNIGNFVCGDFNVNPTSSTPWSNGYFTMVQGGTFIDSFLKIYPDANNIPAQGVYNTIGGTFPGRIDYIFMKATSHFRVVDSQIIFTDQVIGKVSDHYGVLTKISYVP